MSDSWHVTTCEDFHRLRSQPETCCIGEIDVVVDIATQPSPRSGIVTLVCLELDRSGIAVPCTRALSEVGDNIAGQGEPHRGARSVRIGDEVRGCSAPRECKRHVRGSKTGEVTEDDCAVRVVTLPGSLCNGVVEVTIGRLVHHGDAPAPQVRTYVRVRRHDDELRDVGAGHECRDSVEHHRASDPGNSQSGFPGGPTTHRDDYGPFGHPCIQHRDDYPGRMAARVRRRWRLGWGYRLAVVILWPLMTLLTKRTWVGTENLNTDDGGIIVATNHTSWFDPLVIAHVLWNNDRPPRFLAKESVFRVPIVGRVITSAGQIPVYRESSEAVAAVRDAITAVNAGECVVVYPEGTITRDPDMWPMIGKTGAARVALATRRPLIPVAQWGSHDVIRPYRKELRLLPRKTMQVRIGTPVDLTDLYGRPLDSDTLREATSRIIAAITGLLAEIRGETPPAQPMQFRRAPKEEA